MTSDEIRLELFKIRKKITMKDIGDIIDVSKQAVSAEVSRTTKFPSLRIKLAIAEAINCDPIYVWSELLPLKKKGKLNDIPDFGLRNFDRRNN
jgi:transcriptional regulator with XRE-family HTH domain